VRTFDVDVHREGRYWVAVARGVRGGATETRRLANVEPEVRDLLSGLLDLDPDQLQLRLHYQIQRDADQRVREFQDARRELESARRKYETAQRAAVSELRAGGVSLRDSAELLGVSFQRVQQLMHSTQGAA